MNLQFNLYGLIVGIAVVSAISLIEKKYQSFGYPEKNFWKIVSTSLIFGVIGARLWHVITDYNLYINKYIEVFYVWNGGLSIFGGILGGIIGVYLSLRYFQRKSIYKNDGSGKNIKFWEFLDIVIFGLPIGQAIGRLGNFVNQELYGLPASDSILSIFKVYISPEKRLPGFENIEYYHPLFFYEMVATICFSIVLYYLNSKKKLPKIGSGKIFVVYILYYSIIRFFLDFVRIDKAILGYFNFGVNQVVLLIITLISVFWLFKKRQSDEGGFHNTRSLPGHRFLLTSILIFISSIILIMFKLNKSDSDPVRSFNDLSDREIISISIGEKVKLQTEVANTFESTQRGLSGRDEIGSDGLLFIFPDSSIRTFWMVDMKFDLDFVWINGNEIVGFSNNIKKPFPGTASDDIERVMIKKYSDKVLELNSGDIVKYNLEVGDVVILNK